MLAAQDLGEQPSLQPEGRKLAERQSGAFATLSMREGELRYGDDHEIEDHEAMCHEIGDHDVCQSNQGELEQAEVDERDYSMWCQMCNEGNQRRCMVILGKVHTYKTTDCKFIFEQVADGPEVDQPVKVESLVRLGLTTRAREADNQDVLYRAIESRDAERVRSSPHEEANDEGDYPWFAVRAICHWIAERMRSDNTLYWNIDDYDGRMSYEDEGINARQEFARDRETTPEEFKRLRQDLISLEEPYDKTMHSINTNKARRRLKRTINNSWTVGNSHYQRSKVTDTKELQLACFIKGHKRGRTKGTKYNDEESEEESENIMCQMIGENWEQFPFPMIIDSGACISGMPTACCSHVPTEETQESKAGELFRAANGEKIYNEGQKIVSLMTKEGVMRDMRLTSCEVSKALGSVSQICKAGHRVVFNPPWSEEGSYIDQVETGEVMWLSEHNGLYVLDTRVTPTSKQSRTKTNTSFGRQAHP